MSHPRLSLRWRAFLHSVPVVVLAAGCSDSPSMPHEEHVSAIHFQRLLVADAATASASVLTLEDGETLETFGLSAPASGVYRGGNGKVGILAQRTADRVSFVHGGVEMHGDHAHVHEPELLGFTLEESLPTHIQVNGEWITVWFDGTGRAVWFSENDLTSGSPAIVHQVAAASAHHGASATLVVSGNPFLIYTQNPTGSASGVEVQNAQGQIVASVTDCPSLHGNHSISTGGVMGCSDGYVLIRPSGNSVQAQKLLPTGDMAGLGLRNAYASSGGAFILGQFSALPGEPAQRVFATIYPTSGTLTRLPALPGGDMDHWRAVEPIRGQIVFLGRTGTLYVYTGTGQLPHTVANVVPAIPATGALTHQVDVVEGMAAVASPTTGEVVLVSLETGTVIRRMNLGGQPSRISILGALDAGEYHVDNH